MSEAQIPRLFVDRHLETGLALDPGAAAARYLLSVMRLRAGDHVHLFDDRTGEWDAVIEATGKAGGKQQATLRVGEKRRARETVPDVWLCAAPIKKGRWNWVAEKACELGAARLVPVLTRRAVVRTVKPKRLRAHMIEAAEQCGRTALPALAPLTPLAALLADWPEARTLYFFDEEGGDEALPAMQAGGASAGLLIGPEGGFCPQERDAIAEHPAARRLSLGPRVLRADTAAVAALVLWQGALAAAQNKGAQP